MRTIVVGRPRSLGGFDALLAGQASDEPGTSRHELTELTRRLTIALPGRLILTNSDGPILVHAGAAIRAGLDFRGGPDASLRLGDGEYRTAHTIEVEVGLGALTSLGVLSDATVSGHLGERQAFELELSGRIAAVLAGRVQTLTLTLQGQINADLSALDVSQLVIDGNGQLDLKVHALERISGKANGTGSITVTGAPTVRSLEAKGLVALVWN